MYAQPLRDLGFIVGHKLMQICVGPYDAILNFDRGLSISIQGHFVVGNGEPEELPQAAAALFRLLSSEVMTASMEHGANAILAFSNGETLRLLNDSEQYEAYRIVAPDHDVIV